MASHKHYHHAKHHLSSTAKDYTDATGWMEGITSLSDTDRATDLLAPHVGAPGAAVAAPAPPAPAPAAGANGTNGHHAGGATVAPAAVTATMAQLRLSDASGDSVGEAVAASPPVASTMAQPMHTAGAAAAAAGGDDEEDTVDTAPAAAAAGGSAPAGPSAPATSLAAAAGVEGAEGGEEPVDEFTAAMEHALALVSKEVDEMGEVVLELGGPNGWGPQVMDAQALAAAVRHVTEGAAAKGALVTPMRERVVQAQTPNGQVESCVADLLVRKEAGAVGTPIEVRVAIIGNVDSGKSTMVGVLTRSILDDGRGLARSKVFKHNHEADTGRTSSIGQHTLCLDSAGNVLNDNMFKNQTCAEYVQRAAKVITLVDLAGHEKYFRTTAYGLTGHMPDYACLIVGANMGIVGMCKEHMGVALALKVPVFFVITKVDICPEHILKQTVQDLTSILKKPGVRKKPFLVRNVDDVLLCARNMNSDSLAPVFLTSAVTGKGLDLVRIFYNLLPQRQRWSEKQGALTEFVIDETFAVPGVGTVVAGTVKKGVMTPNMTLMLGPDIGDATFKQVAIKSIHYKRLPVQQVVAGQTAALALKKIKRSQVRKGMVLVDERLKPAASWEFDADIAILTHSTTIQPRYQAVIHCEIIRQAARVVAMDCERLRSGDRACVRFRFIQRPEYVTLNTRFVFREGRTKGIGIIIGTEHEQLPLPPAPAPGAPAADDEQQQQQQPHAGGEGADADEAHAGPATPAAAAAAAAAAPPTPPDASRSG